MTTVPLLFRDQFIRANAANLGGNWVQPATATWDITSDQALSVSTAGYAGVKRSVPADCRVIAIEGVLQAGQLGVFARASSWSLGVPANSYRLDINGTTLTLNRINAGVATQLAQVLSVTRVALAALQFDCITLTNGNVLLQGWYNGAMLIQVSDSSGSKLTTGGTQSTGLWDGSTGQIVSLFDSRGDFLWPFTPTGYDMTRSEKNERVDYYSGFQQRNHIWQRPLSIFTFDYTYISDLDKLSMEALIEQTGYGAFALLVPDPRLASEGGWTTQTYAIADGVSTLYKIYGDKVTASGSITYTDGASDGAIIDYMTGTVIYITPPYQGAVLSATIPLFYYRAFMQADDYKIAAQPPTFWKATFNFQTEKLLGGVAM